MCLTSKRLGGSLSTTVTAGLNKRLARLVENDEFHAGQMFGEPALPTVASFGLESVDEFDDLVKGVPWRDKC